MQHATQFGRQEAIDPPKTADKRKRRVLARLGVLPKANQAFDALVAQLSEAAFIGTASPISITGTTSISFQ
jgi:hypothetical protein